MGVSMYNKYASSFSYRCSQIRVSLDSKIVSRYIPKIYLNFLLSWFKKKMISLFDPLFIYLTAWGGYESDSQDVILVDDDPPPHPAPSPLASLHKPLTQREYL